MIFSEHINLIISKIKLQLKTIDLIPSSFNPVETPVGIDRDMLDELISEWETDKLTMTPKECLDELISDQVALKDYIELFSKEIKELTMLEYTNPKSVHKIMDVIGTKGVLNTDNGLCIFEDNKDFKLKKTDWLVINCGQKSIIDKDEKHLYDSFLSNL